MKLLNLGLFVACIVFLLVLVFEAGMYIGQYRVLKLKVEKEMYVGVAITGAVTMAGIVYFGLHAF